MPRRLAFLTYNVSLAEAGRQVSASAPPGFWVHTKCRWLRTEIARAGADAVCLQELPAEGRAWAHEVRPLLDWLGSGAPYVAVGPPVKSHQGLTALWVRASLQPRHEASVPPVTVASVPLALLHSSDTGLTGSSVPGAGDGGNASDASADGNGTSADGTGTGERVYLLGAHCIFGAGRGERRIWQLERALRALPPGARFVVAGGDTNLRGDEEDEKAQRALGLADAALELGLGQQWTWDCSANRYFAGGAWQEDDPGRDSDGGDRPSAFRYDRVYASHGVRPTALRLVGAEEVTPDRGDRLSDHYGLLAELELPDPEPAAAAGAAGQAAEAAAAGGEAAAAEATSTAAADEACKAFAAAPAEAPTPAAAARGQPPLKQQRRS